MNSPAVGDAGPPLVAASGIVVLLVDDQPIVGEAIRRALLTEPDVAFHFCSEPDRAMAVVRATKPTVILQDLVLPGVDGLDLVRKYRADPDSSSIPIIVLSTKEDPRIKSDAFKAGANDYLVKLPDRIELIARVRYHSMAYLVQRQRDEAFRALHESRQQLLAANLELERLTNIDGLTGLSNRRYFDQCIEIEWRRAIRARIPLSLLMIDVDHFKLYNDAYGHIAGDDTLRKVAAAIQGCIRRAGDVVARYGGEEFAVVLPDTPISGLNLIGRRMPCVVEGLGLAHQASPSRPVVTVSIGGATIVPQIGQSLSGFIDSADRALYEAKRSGRNRAVFVSDEVCSSNAKELESPPQ